MKKKMTLIVLALVLVLLLTACGCKHETWKDATCDTPKTCAECGKTEGEALGHVWLAATCDTPKTCEACGLTEGEAKGHSWTDAACEDPKTCTACGLTEGEALGHSWVEATTEAPKTCTVCNATEGDKIVTDPRFTTASTQDIQGAWGLEYDMSPILALELPGWDEPMNCLLMLELNNDGTWSMYMTIEDETVFRESMAHYTLDLLYAEMAAEGYGQEEVDALMESTYGMSTEEFVDASVAEMDLQELLSDANDGGVYYVENGQLYMGFSWEASFPEGTSYSLEGDSLTIESAVEMMEMDKMTFTRVTEE